MLPARSLSFAKIVQVEDNAKKKPKFFSIGIVEAPPILWKDSASRRQCQEKTEVFFQSALLRRRLSYIKIVQVEDNAKEKHEVINKRSKET